MGWAREYLAAAQVTDLARDPNDYRVTRQSAVTINGLLVPVSAGEYWRIKALFKDYGAAFSDNYMHGQYTQKFTGLTATMQVLIARAARRGIGKKDLKAGAESFGFHYISIDPRDYTLFTAPHVDVPVVSIHTRPERCWFLGLLKLEGALGLSLGRMRVMRPTKQGVYPVTIRTKWRALTNKVKQEEVRDAYRRLTQT